MPIPRIFRSSSFRFTALTAVAFGIGALIYGGIVYYGVRMSMERQLREQVQAETAYLVGDYEDNGLDELRHDIGERLERAPTQRLYYTLANAHGVGLFDRMELPSAPGWARVERSGMPALILLVTPLRDGYRLGVAAEARSVDEISHALRRTTLLQALALSGIGIGVGTILSRRFLRRVERLRRTAEAVGHGHLSERVPIEGSNDDFDQVAAEINRMLARIEELVGESRRVASDIAHDLRTPLGAARRRLESLLELSHDAASRGLCEEALQSIESALETFSALLRISELESGRSHLSLESFDVSELLARLHESYEPVAEAQGQSVDLDASPGVRIFGDRALVTQLIVNLIENAIRHNGPGIRTRLVARTQGEVSWVEIVDDGVGIPQAERVDVVKPFFRMDRSRRTPGSGLGLSLAARIAERHGSALQLADAAPGLHVSVAFRATGAGPCDALPSH